jgi:alpha-amylase
VVEAACNGDHVSAEGTAGAAGEHHIRVAGRQLPEQGAPFSIDVTYLAPQVV